jgi:hypothetical protein
LGAVSDEQSKRFPETVSILEQYYQGRWKPAMTEDFVGFFKVMMKPPTKEKITYVY